MTTPTWEERSAALEAEGVIDPRPLGSALTQEGI